MAHDVKVLVVEDDSADLEITRRFLATANGTRFHVVTSQKLPDALGKLESGTFDVLLLDLNLSGSHGLDTLDAVRRVNNDLPIVVLSGMSDEEVALASLDHGAQDYLVKRHVTAHVLRIAIRYAMARQQLLKEITAAKELLEKKNARLAELYETAHRFVDNVSHEFRTPLTVIKEYASIVGDGLIGQVTAEQRRFLDIVGDRADDLNTMVDDMLDFSKLEAGMLGAWRRTWQVSQIVDHVRQSLERKAAIKGVTLEVDLEQPLPEVFCDDEKVGRVIVNLAVNAIKFCRDGGRVRIWAREDEESRGVVIGVSDNGPGIDQENLARIFQRFQQLDTNLRTSCKGFGLGLNIAKELVDLSFGEMNVESDVGQGSTFSFTLPASDPTEVLTRYLKRAPCLHNGLSRLSLVLAAVDETVEEDEHLEDIDAFLASLLRRSDLAVRVSRRQWLLVLAVNEMELGVFHDRALSLLRDVNRNRIHGPLPEVKQTILGSWHPVTGRKQIIDTLRRLVEVKEVACV